MIQKQENGKQILRQAVLICFCVYFLMCDILVSMIPGKYSSDFGNLERLICYSFLGLILASIPNASRKKSLSFLAFFWVWMIVIRLAIQQLTEAMTVEIFRVGIMCAVFYLTSTLDAKGKQHLADVFCGMLFPVLTFLAILGLLVSTNVIPSFRIGDAEILLVVHPYGSGTAIYVSFLGINKNVTATWFLVALWLAVGQFFRTRRKWLRVLLGLFAVLMYAAMSLQYCRFVNIACAVGAGMLAVLLVKDRLKIPKTVVRKMAVGLIAVVVMFGCYKGCNLWGGLLNQFAGPDMLKNAHMIGYSSIQEEQAEEEEAETVAETEAEPVAETKDEPAAETEAEPATEAEAESMVETETELVTETEAEPAVETEAEPETEPETQPTTESNAEADELSKLIGDATGVGDGRNFFKDLVSLTGRTDIWAAALRVIFRRKKFMLLGQPVGDIGMNMIYYGDYDILRGHTHNMFIQVLAQTGIIGFGLMVAFTYMQVRAAIQLFFSREQPLSRKIYGILLTCLLLEGVGESLLLLQFAPLALMFTAGMLADQEEPTDFRKLFRFRKKKA